MILTTVEKVREYLRISSDADDQLFQRLIEACSKVIENYCLRDFEQKKHVDKFSGNNQGYHECKFYPIISVELITIDNVVVDFKDFDENTIYLKDNQNFTKGRINCYINYTAGYLTVPKDLEQACIELVGIKYKQIETLNVSSKGLAGETTNFIVKDMPDYVKVVLNKYRRVTLE